MMEDDDEIVARSARSSSLSCQTAVEQADEDNIQTDFSTKDSTTNDPDDKDRTNVGTCIPRNAAVNIDQEQRTKYDKERETRVSSSHEAGDSSARGPLVVSHEQQKGDDESTRRTTFNNKKEFLWKIHELLDELSQEQKDHIVSWSPNGTSFKVHNPEAFVQEVMPRYSTATQFRSFEKMLNLYDFKKIKGGPQRGGYQHPLFRRDDRELCKKIKMRPKPKRRNKGSRDSLGRRKSHVEHDFDDGLDEHFSEQRGSSLEDLGDHDDDDQNLSSIDDISMGYFQQMAATTNTTNVGGVPPNLRNHDDSLVHSLEKAHLEGHASRLYQNVLDMRKSPQLATMIGGTMTTSGSIMLMNDTARSSAAATNQQQFTMFDPTIFSAPPSSTAHSTGTGHLVGPLHHDPHSASRFHHAAPSKAAVAGSFLQPPTTMVGSVGSGVVGGMIPSFPGLMSGPSAVVLGPARSTASSATMMTTRSTTPSATPQFSETRINPLSLEPPIYNHFFDLGAGPGTSSANIFVDGTSIHHQQQAHQATEQLRPQEQLYSSSTTRTSTDMMSPSLSLSSFDPTVIAKQHHQDEKEDHACDDDLHHSKEVERMIFEEPLSDDLEPNPLP